MIDGDYSRCSEDTAPTIFLQSSFAINKIIS